MSALYRLSKDPQELRDLSAKYRNVARSLEQRLRPYLSEQADHEWDSVDHLCIAPPAVSDIKRGPNGMPAAVPWCIIHKKDAFDERPADSHENAEATQQDASYDTEEANAEATHQEDAIDDSEQTQPADAIDDSQQASAEATHQEDAVAEAEHADQDNATNPTEDAEPEDAKDEDEHALQDNATNTTEDAQDYDQQEEAAQAAARAAVGGKEIADQAPPEDSAGQGEEEYASNNTDQDQQPSAGQVEEEYADNNTDQDQKYSWDVTAAPEAGRTEDVEDAQHLLPEESPRPYQEDASEESTELESVPHQEECADDDQSIIDAMTQRGYQISGCVGLKYYCNNQDLGPLIQSHCRATCTACNEEHQYSWDVAAALPEATGQ